MGVASSLLSFLRPPLFRVLLLFFLYFVDCVPPSPPPLCVARQLLFLRSLRIRSFCFVFSSFTQTKKKEHEGEDMLNPLRTKRMTRKCLYSRPRPFRPRPLILLANERQICMVCSQSVPILFDSFPCSFRSFSFTFVPPYCVACALSVRLIYK